MNEQIEPLIANDEKDFKILFLEDNKDFREIIKEILEDDINAFNQETNLAKIDPNLIMRSSSEEAIKEILTTPEIKLAIVDLQLPTQQGIEFIEHLRSLKIPDVGIIIETGHGSPELPERAMELGVFGIFYKPFNPKLLAKKIFRYVQERYRRKSIYIEERFIPDPKTQQKRGPYKYVNWVTTEGKKKSLCMGKLPEAPQTIFDHLPRSHKRGRKPKQQSVQRTPEKSLQSA